MAYQLTRKNFELPEKGKCRYYKEITRAIYLRIKENFNTLTPSWGRVVNNPCFEGQHKTHAKISLEEVSYMNTGVNARYYIVIK